jgi:hypothetical protein
LMNLGYQEAALPYRRHRVLLSLWSAKIVVYSIIEYATNVKSAG